MGKSKREYEIVVNLPEPEDEIKRLSSYFLKEYISFLHEYLETRDISQGQQNRIIQRVINQLLKDAL